MFLAPSGAVGSGEMIFRRYRSDGAFRNWGNFLQRFPRTFLHVMSYTKGLQERPNSSITFWTGFWLSRFAAMHKNKIHSRVPSGY